MDTLLRKYVGIYNRITLSTYYQFDIIYSKLEFLSYVRIYEILTVQKVSTYSSLMISLAL